MQVIAYPYEAFLEYLGEDLLESTHDDDECGFEGLLRPVRIGEDLVHVLDQAATRHGIRIVRGHLQKAVSYLSQPLQDRNGRNVRHRLERDRSKPDMRPRLFNCNL